MSISDTISVKVYQHHLLTLHSFLNNSQDNTKESNPKFHVIPQWKVCDVRSLIYNIHWRSNDQWKCANLTRNQKEPPNWHQGILCCKKAGKELKLTCRKLMGQSWRENWTCQYQFETLDSNSVLWFQRKQSMSFNSSFFVFLFVFLIKLYSFKKMQTSLRRWRNRSRMSMSYLQMSSHTVSVQSSLDL